MKQEKNQTKKQSDFHTQTLWSMMGFPAAASWHTIHHIHGWTGESQQSHIDRLQIHTTEWEQSLSATVRSPFSANKPLKASQLSFTSLSVFFYNQSWVFYEDVGAS